MTTSLMHASASAAVRTTQGTGASLARHFCFTIEFGHGRIAEPAVAIAFRMLRDIFVPHDLLATGFG